jgi:hypothetical protein
MLAEDSGKPPLYYDVCKLSGFYGGAGPTAPDVADVGQNLGRFLAQAAANGQVDVIAYSSGGLFVRAY